ncbi:MAG: hypothetical protein NTX86_03710 [Candidatus Dependentiae bacterium]|nr:hypothetical protein [Candidatus Dependentiae bacterium]
MRIIFVIVLLLLPCSTHPKKAAHSSLQKQLNALTPKQLERIGNKIWDNESNKSIDKLTWWIKGESCASLGIGHFIWYPKNGSDGFTQTFPALLEYLVSHGVALPTWLTCNTACPWSTHADFFAAFASKQMQELRTLLSTTIDLQTKFMIHNACTCFDTMLAQAPRDKKATIKKQLECIAQDNNGLYALVDYQHCKGIGVNKNERYNDKGWGLLQVLEEMQNTQNNKSATQEFAECAKKILTERTENAPQEKNEQRFLLGWKKRINTYTQPL